jgi:glycosyltransferase involved in cell wall biosynthesis
MSKPLVSVLTPTYNRRRFIPYLIDCFKKQNYPQNRLEWIIFDDGTDKVGDLFEKSGLKNVRYYSEDIKLNIGAKRNKLNEMAKGDICVCMDDDDYYPPERVEHVVTKLLANPKYMICGSTELYMYYSDNTEIYRIGPYNQNHATNGTMGYRSSYFKNHKYDEYVTHAEETSFLNAYKEPMLQLDPFKVMLVISHSDNTFDKRTLRKQTNPMFKLTTLKIHDFIKDAKLCEFYGMNTYNLPVELPTNIVLGLPPSAPRLWEPAIVEVKPEPIVVSVFAESAVTENNSVLSVQIKDV